MSDAIAEPIIAVFDSNILVRIALAKTNRVKQLWQAAQAGRYRLLISESILAELGRVLRYPRIRERYKLTDVTIDDFLNSLRLVAFTTQDLYQVSRVQADETDNIFLACALEGNADYVVSEDPHLRDIKDYQGISIIGIVDFQKVIGL
jgi:putative PIN family toxin of toxin-antitoxin system